MAREGECRLCLVFLACIAGVTGKPPPGLPWTGYSSKPVYSRPFGPPTTGSVGTITVPYIQKPSLFPKLVDPKAMISKKLDLLDALLNGIGPVDLNSNLAQPTGGGYDETLSSKKYPQVADFERGLFGPGGPTGVFGPVGPMGLKFPIGSTGSTFGSTGPYRRKRSTTAADEKTDFLNTLVDKVDSKSSSNSDPPPPYPGLGPIPEEPESDELQSSMGKLQRSTLPISTPKGYLPGTFGPMVDPSTIIAKKMSFLDTLFKSIATATPPTTTDAPVPKSTIVPPSFWYPSSIIPGPTEYKDKVSVFLDKLFDSLKSNLTTAQADSSPTENDGASTSGTSKVTRSLKDLATIAATKDSIVDSILSELSDVKSEMMTTLDDLIAYQKTTIPPGKPTKPFKPFAGIWPLKPAVDPTLPYKQRMAVLSQVFDMLTELQRNISTNVAEAIKSNIGSMDPETTQNFLDGGSLLPGSSSDASVDMTLLDAIRSKLAAMDSPDLTGQPVAPWTIPAKALRMLPKGPTSFWVSYPQSSATTAKRQATDESEIAMQAPDGDRRDRYQDTRGSGMQVRQGYQSLPPRPIEYVHAGHQGEGTKYFDSPDYRDFDKLVNWRERLQKEFEGFKYHHHSRH